MYIHQVIESYSPRLLDTIKNDSSKIADVVVRVYCGILITIVTLDSSNWSTTNVEQTTLLKKLVENVNQ